MAGQCTDPIKLTCYLFWNHHPKWVSVLSGQVASTLFMSSKFENLCWSFSFQNILTDQNLLLEMHLEWRYSKGGTLKILAFLSETALRLVRFCQVLTGRISMTSAEIVHMPDRGRDIPLWISLFACTCTCKVPDRNSPGLAPGSFRRVLLLLFVSWTS